MSLKEFRESVLAMISIIALRTRDGAVFCSSHRNNKLIQRAQ
jgi:hypothetical protein